MASFHSCVSFFGALLLLSGTLAILKGTSQSPNTSGAGQPVAAPGALAEDDDKTRWIEAISWSPRAFIYHNFLSHAEVEHMLMLVESKIARSQVVDTATGEFKIDSVRTSHSAGLDRGQDEVISSIEARIAEWTHMPPENGEPMQVLRYENLQKYDAHWDYFFDPVHTVDPEENRAATVVMYLGDVEEGGETTLPLGLPIDPARQAMVNPSECAAKGNMAVVPKKGDALLFWDMHVDGKTVDRQSLHASCPTIRGVKYVATKWIHNKPYGIGFDPLKLAAECKDKLPVECPALVAAGRCDTDPGSMLGLMGTCRKSCGDCVECVDNDMLCLRGNMRSRRLGVRQATNARPPVL